MSSLLVKDCKEDNLCGPTTGRSIGVFIVSAHLQKETQLLWLHNSNLHHVHYNVLSMMVVSIVATGLLVHTHSVPNLRLMSAIDYNSVNGTDAHVTSVADLFDATLGLSA